MPSFWAMRCDLLRKQKQANICSRYRMNIYIGCNRLWPFLITLLHTLAAIFIPTLSFLHSLSLLAASSEFSTFHNLCFDIQKRIFIIHYNCSSRKRRCAMRSLRTRTKKWTVVSYAIRHHNSCIFVSVCSIRFYHYLLLCSALCCFFSLVRLWLSGWNVNKYSQSVEIL